jgi:hypothetical protein
MSGLIQGVKEIDARVDYLRPVHNVGGGTALVLVLFLE